MCLLQMAHFDALFPGGPSSSAAASRHAADMVSEFEQAQVSMMVQFEWARWSGTAWCCGTATAWCFGAGLSAVRAGPALGHMKLCAASGGLSRQHQPHSSRRSSVACMRGATHPTTCAYSACLLHVSMRSRYAPPASHHTIEAVAASSVHFSCLAASWAAARLAAWSNANGSATPRHAATAPTHAG